MILSKPESLTYAVACNPLLYVYHVIECKPNQEVNTGLPIIVWGLTKQDAYDIVFSDWIEDEDGNIISSSTREFMWSIDYTKEEADIIIADLSFVMPNIIMEPIKHPDRDEYAIPFDEYVFEKLPTSPEKDELRIKHLEKISEGNSKQTNWMVSDGWV